MSKIIFNGKEVSDVRKALMYVQITSRNDQRPKLGENAFQLFEIKRSTNRSFVIFEALIATWMHPYGHEDTVVLSCNGKEAMDVYCSINLGERELNFFDGKDDGHDRVRVEGNTLYTKKVGSWIGDKGANVKLLSKYLGRVEIKKDLYGS